MALGPMGKGGMPFPCSHPCAHQMEQSFPTSQGSPLDWEMLEDRAGILFIICGPGPHLGNNSYSSNS